MAPANILLLTFWPALSTLSAATEAAEEALDEI
jgi:hypothetical protein